MNMDARATEGDARVARLQRGGAKCQELFDKVTVGKCDRRRAAAANGGAKNAAWNRAHASR